MGSSNEAVSPVIGVILLVAITIIIAVILAMLAFGFSENLQKIGQAGVTVEDDKISLVDKGNSDEIIIRNESGGDVATMNSAGDIFVPEASGTYQVISVKNGNENVIRTITIGSNNDQSKTFSTSHDSAPDCSNYLNSTSYEQADDGYYLVKDDYDLQCITHHNLSADYRLDKNIDASGTSNWNSGKGFSPIGDPSGAWSQSFKGSFDGNGKTIDGLYVNRDHGAVGLIAWTETASVNNLKLTNANITSTSGYGIGGISGANYDTVEFKNIEFSGKVTGVEAVGGIAGDFYGTELDSITVDATVNGTIWVGGIAGATSTPGVIDSSTTGEVNGNVGSSIEYVGGLIGDWTPSPGDNATISNSYSEASVYSEGNNVGGLVGKLGVDYDNEYATIKNSYYSGSVYSTGEYNTGGLVGKMQDTNSIVNSYSTGSVTQEVVTSGWEGYVGGLVGQSISGTIKDSYSESTVNREGLSNEEIWYSGGLVGWNNGGNINNSYATGSVTGDAKVGGLVGWSWSDGNGQGTISNSYATGKVTSLRDGHAGGLAGVVNEGTFMEKNYATGSVVVNEGTNGGGWGGALIGLLNGGVTVKQSYAIGDVSGGSIGGGLVGELQGSGTTLKNSYATGNSISGTDYSGGLVGRIRGDATLTESFAAENSLSGSGYIGGIAGALEELDSSGNTGEAVKVYWNTDSHGYSAVGYKNGTLDATGLTTSDMQGSSSLDSGNMGSLSSPPWSTTSGYPELEWEN